MPDSLHFVGLFALGATVASFLNLAIYQLAWFPRSISPWSAAPAGATKRSWSDRVPIFGWFTLRREAAIHGRGFWLRPMLIEVSSGVALAWLYWWDVEQAGVFSAQLAVHGVVGSSLAANTIAPGNMLHWQFVAQAVLFSWMLVATFIDIDERIIPDEVTLSGTLLGLMLAVLVPSSWLVSVDWFPVPPPSLEVGTPLQTADGIDLASQGQQLHAQRIHLAAPNSWPQLLVGRPALMSLLIGLACYSFWIFAILPRRRRIWYRRRGLRWAVRLFVAQIRRSLRAWYIRALAPLGAIGVVIVWSVGGERWAALLTALVGLVVAGSIVWAVRVIGRAALKKEAMGFGDVTLMMMIGSFVGWQAALIIFFLAPLAGVLIGIGQIILRRDQMIPYGPFLCLATVVVIVRWADVWGAVKIYFELWWLVPSAVVLCLVVMAPLLWIVHVVKIRFVPEDA